MADKEKRSDKEAAIAKAQKLRSQGYRQDAINVATAAGLAASDVPFIEGYQEPAKAK